MSFPAHPTFSIFQEAWWLDAVAPRQWRRLEVKRGTELAAWMPIVECRRWGFNGITMPPLTQTLGPWMRTTNGKYSKQLSDEKELLEELINQLPKHHYIQFHMPVQLTNWLPFYWNGFTQTTLYTYRFESLSDHDQIWSGFRENIRTDIKKASKNLTVQANGSLEHFLELHSMTFERQGLMPPIDHALIRRLDEACNDHDARRIFVAEDAMGQRHAAVYLVWDQNAAYYLMSGADPKLRNSGATSLLVWEAIKFASSVTRVFDFEGSMLEPVERFVRGFGARQTPYFRLTRASKPLQFALALQRLARR